MASRRQLANYYFKDATVNLWNFALWGLVSIVGLILVPISGGLSLLLEVLFLIPVVYNFARAMYCLYKWRSYGGKLNKIPKIRRR